MELLKRSGGFYETGNKLYSFSHIKKTDASELAVQLLELYENGLTEQKLLASLLNAVYSSDKPIFLFSASLFREIIGLDKNLNRDSLSGSEYKRFLKMIIEKGFFDYVVKPEQFSKGKRKAGLLRLVDKELRTFISDIEEKEKQAIELFCKIEKIETIVLTKIET